MKLIWNYFKSNLLTLALLAGVALGLFLLIRYNPLGLFSSTKISLADTPTVIRELKELGEFVTSEYSGETIESLQEGTASQIRIQQRMDSLRSVFVQMQTLYPAIAKTRKKAAARARAFRDSRPYRDVPEDIRLLQIATEKSLGELLEYSISEGTTWESLLAAHPARLEKEVETLLNKGARGRIKVAYIGRGRVRAGFDLSHIDNPIFQIEMARNATQDTLVIRNLDPEILDADINPWFIYRPEADIRVPGYELIKLKREAKVEFADITAVKMACKETLVSQALYEREILNHALFSGEQTFRDLFNLFRKPDEPPLAAVRIEPTPYYEFKAGILKDRRIETSEIRDIRTRLTQDGLALNTPAARALILSIGKRPEWLVDPVAWQGLRSEAGL